jgi:sugar phosphate isomerase/epimerase
MAVQTRHSHRQKGGVAVFRLGFSSLACPDYDVDQLISLATSNGYSGVELRFVRGQVDLTQLPEFGVAELATTRQRFADAGVEVVCIDTSVRQSMLDGPTRAAERAAARANVQIAVGLGAPYIRVFGGPIPAEQDRERTLDAIAEGLSVVGEEAAAHGVTAVLESHDDFCTSESILDLYRRGMSPLVKVLWDTLHTYRYGETPEHTWGQIGPLVSHVHVKDSYVADEHGFDFAPTGEGVIPLEDIVRVLRTGGYEGYVHFEWEKAWHPEIADGEIAVPQFARYMAGVR